MEPKASIVIPAYNSASTLEETLLSVIKQDCEIPYEIIVVNDGSTDETATIALNFIEQYSNLNIKLVNQPHRGAATARNKGASISKGDFILFIDSDCMANPQWINALIRHFSDPEVAGVGGTYRSLNSDKWVSRYIGYDIEFRHNRMGSWIDFVGTYSAAFRSKVFFEVGGFDEKFTSANAEDNDLSYRITAKGFRLLFEPEAWVYHKHVSTLSAFLKQQYDRAKWRVALYQKHPKRMLTGDKYATTLTLIQPYVWILGIASAVILGFIIGIYGLIIPLMLMVTSLFFLNFQFIKWIHSKEKSILFTFYSTLLGIIRSLTWLIGSLHGDLEFLIISRFFR